MYEINPDKQIELLRWLFTTLDAQWLAKTAAAYNPTEAARLNERVRGAMGRTEMKAVLSLLGHSQAAGLGQAAEIVQAYIALAYGERGFSGTFRPIQAVSPGLQRLEIEVARFSALEAIRKLAQANGERPQALIENFWNGWFETLLPNDQLDIKVQLGNNAPDLITITATSVISFEPPLEEELSPIAAALQIPLEPTRPATYPFTSGYNYKPGSEPTPIGYSEATEAPMPPSALPASSSPISEPGTERKQQAGGLQERLARSQKTSLPDPNWPPAPPPALQNSAEQVVPLPPPGVLRVDQVSGRSLFRDDMEEDAKRSIERRKAQTQKGLPLVSRLMLSKEARELLQQSGDQRPIEPFSLASGVEAGLQRLLTEEMARQPGSIISPVHVVGGPEGELQIHVGGTVYASVGDVPAGRVRELLQQAIDEWISTQEG